MTMKQRKNILPQGNGASRFHGQPAVKPQLPKPGIMQPKMATASQMKKMPVAPPVYRPTLTAVQAKMANANRKLPAAPPVYRPQPKAIQPKMAQASPPAVQPKVNAARLAAPAVYRPLNGTQVAQPKMRSEAKGKKGSAALTAHRPQPVPKIARPSAIANHQAGQSANIIRRQPVSPPMSRQAPKSIEPGMSGASRHPNQAQARRVPVAPSRPQQSTTAQLKTPAAIRSAQQIQRKPAAASRTNHAAVIQPYFTISKGSVYRNDPSTIGNLYNLVGTIVHAPNTTTFPAQEKDANSGSFLNPNKPSKANIQTNLQPALRISDDYQMAIEETNLNHRQAKSFFAVQSVVAHANAELQRVNSTFELVSTPETITIHSPWNRSRYMLNKVVPRITGHPLPNPLKMRAEQNCNDFASQVTGEHAERELIPKYATANNASLPTQALSTDINLVVAQLVAKRMKTEKDTAPTFKKSKVISDNDYKVLRETEEGRLYMSRKEAQAVQEIVRRYVNALKKWGSHNVLREFGINEYAAPDVGDAFVTTTVGEQDKATNQVKDLRTGKSFVPLWGYHFGGVVAKSGNDMVTLENYARDDEDKNVMGQKPLNGQDPRWFFQMYGGKHAGQSFHQAQVNSGGFANPLTLALQNPNRNPIAQPLPMPYQPQPSPAMLTTGQVAMGGALLTVITGMVLRKYNLI